jgi:hypothetical protein
MSIWIAGAVGAICGLLLAMVWLVAIRILLSKFRARTDTSAGVSESASGSTTSQTFEPIPSLLDPDDQEPATPLPSQSMAPLNFRRYVEVKGAIKAWAEQNEDVATQLDGVFGITMDTFNQADQWWAMTLEGNDEQLEEVERQVCVYAERYGGKGT